MLDEFTLGESVSKVIAKNNAKPYSPFVGQPSLSVKLLCCTICDFRIKSVAALKQHMMKSDKSPTVKCDVCGFESNETDVINHKLEFHLVHQQIHKQVKRKKAIFTCCQCGITVDTKKKLNNHMGSQHPGHEESSSSSEPSPPRKRPAKSDQVSGADDSVVEIMEMIIDEVFKEDAMKDITQKENKDNIMKAQAIKIKDQEKQIQHLEANVATLIQRREDEQKSKRSELKLVTGKNQFLLT